MWKVALNKSIRELRFVVKNSPEHHGVWWDNSSAFFSFFDSFVFVLNKRNFVQHRLPELTFLNRNTFFSVDEISDEFTETDSAVHIIYGDCEFFSFLFYLFFFVIDLATQATPLRVRSWLLDSLRRNLRQSWRRELYLVWPWSATLCRTTTTGTFLWKSSRPETPRDTMMTATDSCGQYWLISVTINDIKL